MGHDLLGKANHGFRSGNFKIKRNLDGVLQRRNIAVLNVATVFSQMACDVVGPTEFAKNGSLHGVRIRLTSRLANGCNVVNVDAKPDHDFLPVGAAALAC